MADSSAIRRPGRPPSKRGANVRAALLAAARESIVELGFAGASTKHIAARAGVNPAMISYYFGSKAELGEAAFRDTIEPVRERFDALARSGQSGADLFEFLREYMSALAAHPWIPRMVVREVLPETGRFREIFFREIAGRGAAILPATIVAAQKDGTISASLDPRFAAISIASLAVFPFLMAELLDTKLGVSLSNEKTFEDFVRHTHALLVAGFSGAKLADHGD